MSLYVYCPVGSTGARDLAKASGARRVKSLSSTRLKKGDLIVFWGAALAGDFDQIQTLNNVPGISKLLELKKLEKAGVRVPEFSLTPKDGFLARVRNHQGGKDLLSGRQTGDFYVRRLSLEREFRVHVFQGQSIRLGMKVPRVGVKQHPWIRSYDGGWKLSYGQDAQQGVVSGVRSAAKAAVHALGLDFGAVDVGVSKEGKVYVLEVNRRPGLEGKTIEVYAACLKSIAA